MATGSGGSEDGKFSSSPSGSAEFGLPVKVVPGVSEFAALASPLPSETPQPEWLKDLDQEDINMLQDFSSLTAAQLLERVKDLQNLAYQLGLQEAREMTRGKFLNILERSSRRRR